MKLVIVESPSKSKTIQGYLGKGYKVLSSKGHIADLPKSGLGVDVDKKFAPEYVVTKKDVLKSLKAELKGVEEVLLATDPDREGEAIGWHIARELGLLAKRKKDAPKLSRIVFTEITKSAIQAAIEKPRAVDQNLVDAQQARRILDRLVGYKLSPLLWKKIRYGLSAGRVQSVAVKLVVDRENERTNFKPDESWEITAEVSEQKAKVKTEFKLSQADADDDEVDDSDSDFVARLSKWKGKKPEFAKQKDAEKVVEHLADQDWFVNSISSTTMHKSPSPPLMTSTLQAAAVNIFGFSAKRTMDAAQKLYEAGLITYMRTDSLQISAQAIESLRKFIVKEFGEKSLSNGINTYKSKSKVAQEAHEAIRPTDTAVNPKKTKLEGDQAKVYALIWQRAVASQMAPVTYVQSTMTITAGEGIFSVTGRQIKDKGYLKAMPEKFAEYELPAVAEGKQVYPTMLSARQKFTAPPPRFSEASLIKELERLGIGRPSTYAPIIQTIQQRKYVEKLGRYFNPTDTGIVVTKLLAKHFKDIVDTDFTADMEDQLDRVADGKLEWVKMLSEFYFPFAKKLVEKEKDIKREDFTVIGPAPADMKCPECGKEMEIKLGKYGRFYSCTTFPECKGIVAIEGANGPGDEGINLEDYEGAPRTDDGRDYALKVGRFGQFWAHPDYPKVKDAKPLVLKHAILVEKYGEPPKSKDGKEYLLRKGRFGFFWAHPNYPKEKDIIPIKKTDKAEKSAKQAEK